MPRDGSLTVIGKDVDHVLVDEDPQSQVLSFLQLEGRIDVAQRQRLAGIPILFWM